MESCHILIPTIYQKNCLHSALNQNMRHGHEKPRYEICHSISLAHSFADYINNLQFKYSPTLRFYFLWYEKGRWGSILRRNGINFRGQGSDLSLIGPEWSQDLDTGLWLVQSDLYWLRGVAEGAAAIEV